MDFQSSVMHSSIVENWSRRGPLVPWVTFAVIVLCILMSLLFLLLAAQDRSFMMFRLGGKQQKQLLTPVAAPEAQMWNPRQHIPT